MAPPKPSAKNSKASKATDLPGPPNKVTKKTSKTKQKKVTPGTTGDETNVGAQQRQNIDQGDHGGIANPSPFLSTSTNTPLSTGNLDMASNNPNVSAVTAGSTIIQAGSQFGVERAMNNDYSQNLTINQPPMASGQRHGHPGLPPLSYSENDVGTSSTSTDNTSTTQTTYSAYDPAEYLASRAQVALDQANAQAALDQASTQAVVTQVVATQATVRTNVPTTAQAAPTVSTTAAVSALVRAVPHHPNAAHEITAGQQDYENDVRALEGDFRSILHQRVMLETGNTSWFSRKMLPDRERAIFDAVTQSLVSRIPTLDPNHLLMGPDSIDSPLSVRLFNLFFSALVAQYGDSFAAQRATLQEECFIEARAWVMDKFRELDGRTRIWMVDHAHLQQARQRHMELPSRR